MNEDSSSFWRCGFGKLTMLEDICAPFYSGDSLKKCGKLFHFGATTSGILRLLKLIPWLVWWWDIGPAWLAGWWHDCFVTTAFMVSSQGWAWNNFDMYFWIKWNLPFSRIYFFWLARYFACELKLQPTELPIRSISILLYPPKRCLLNVGGKYCAIGKSLRCCNLCWRVCKVPMQNDTACNECWWAMTFERFSGR